MRRSIAGLVALLAMTWPAYAKPAAPVTLNSTDAVQHWINEYRAKPDPKAVPDVTIKLSELGALRDPERSGVYIGFLAGVLGANPQQAPALIAKTLTMPRDDRWIVVRAIAYSGLPNWSPLLKKAAAQMPERSRMIEKYRSGKSPTLDQLVIAPSPSQWQRFTQALRIEAVFGKPNRPLTLEASPEVLDILWGYYFATGSFGPLKEIIAMLEWSDDRNDVERLTIGSMAKFTLAMNASRSSNLLATLKSASKARNQPEKTVAALNEVIDAAETVEMSRIRQQAMAAIDELRRKGPAYKRAATWWSYIGQSVIAGGCIAATIASVTAAGLPCVIGGATASAAMNFVANQP
ncbi:MAG: hypothetical protein ABI830_09710 [Pseudolabrys sp.]